ESINAKTEVNLEDIELEVYDFDELKDILFRKDDKTYVINFWATWCAPCIKELPYFERVNQELKNSNVEVILVSLDFPKKYESSLKPFIKKKDLQSRLIALDDTDQNTWIPGINEDWSGAIPATLIYNKDKRQFYEKSFTYNELITEIDKFKN
ncbi:MAG: TlpA family protein disulfide reductase, partial [Flavobacteriaceae bacterium]|nr:TlpA family protein disulfide reductase [Flavobacteriaceae bacterium]